MASIIVRWYVPQKIVYFGWPEHVTLATIEQVSSEGCTLLDQVDSPAYILNDARFVKTFPIDIRRVRTGMTFLQHPNLDWLVSVTSNGMVTLMANTVPQIFTNVKNAAFGDVDLALRKLRMVDQAIDWSVADENVLLPSLAGNKP